MATSTGPRVTQADGVDESSPPEPGSSSCTRRHEKHRHPFASAATCGATVTLQRVTDQHHRGDQRATVVSSLGGHRDASVARSMRRPRRSESSRSEARDQACRPSTHDLWRASAIENKWTTTQPFDDESTARWATQARGTCRTRSELNRTPLRQIGFAYFPHSLPMQTGHDISRSLLRRGRVSATRIFRNRDVGFGLRRHSGCAYSSRFALGRLLNKRRHGARGREQNKRTIREHTEKTTTLTSASARGTPQSTLLTLCSTRVDSLPRFSSNSATTRLTSLVLSLAAPAVQAWMRLLHRLSSLALSCCDLRTESQCSDLQRSPEADEQLSPLL